MSHNVTINNSLHTVVFGYDGTLKVNDANGVTIARGERYANGICSVNLAEFGQYLTRQKICAWESLEELADSVATCVERLIENSEVL